MIKSIDIWYFHVVNYIIWTMVINIFPSVSLTLGKFFQGHYLWDNAAFWLTDIVTVTPKIVASTFFNVFCQSPESFKVLLYKKWHQSRSRQLQSIWLPLKYFSSRVIPVYSLFRCKLRIHPDVLSILYFPFYPPTEY